MEHDYPQAGINDVRLLLPLMTEEVGMIAAEIAAEIVVEIVIEIRGGDLIVIEIEAVIEIRTRIGTEIVVDHDHATDHAKARQTLPRSKRLAVMGIRDSSASETVTSLAELGIEESKS